MAWYFILIILIYTFYTNNIGNLSFVANHQLENQSQNQQEVLNKNKQLTEFKTIIKNVSKKTKEIKIFKKVSNDSHIVKNILRTITIKNLRWSQYFVLNLTTSQHSLATQKWQLHQRYWLSGFIKLYSKQK